MLTQEQINQARMAAQQEVARTSPQSLSPEELKKARMASLADVARKEVEASRNPVADFGSGVNKTLISVAGFPVDVANKALSLMGVDSPMPVGGSDWLTDKAASAGLVNTGMDENAPERIGKIAGTAIPGIGAIGGLARGTSMTAPILQGFRSAPGAFMGVEVASGIGAGVGGEIGREQGPMGEIAGQIIGGIAAPYTLSFTAKLPTFRLVRKAISMGTETGVKNRAAELVQRTTKNGQLVANLANKADVIPGNKLTTGGLSESTRLTALEKAVARKLPALADDMAKNEAKTNHAIIKALETHGDIDSTVMYFQAQKMRVENALRARMAAAVTNMDQAISKLKPNSTRADASRIISRELEDALSDARIQENITWDALDGTQKLGLTSTRKAFNEFITDETPIPSFVRESLKGKGVKIMSFKDVRELRSKILRVQRFARSQGNAEEAWVLNQINKGILDDITNSNLGPDFEAAVGFSRSLNEKFTRGPVGNVLRFSSRGGKAVAPELVSEEILSTTAPKAANAVRAVRKATGSNAAMEDALADSVKNRLFKSTGEFDTAAAKKFVESNGELLNEFPGLKNQIVNSFDNLNARNALEKRIAKAQIGLVDRRRSAAAVMLNASPDKRLSSILIHPKRKMLLAQAVRVSKKGDDAFEGLQDAYSRQLFLKGQSTRIDESGRKMMSGQAMRKFFNSTKDDMLEAGLYTKDDIHRLDKVIRTAEKLEKQVLTRAHAGPIDSSNAGMFEDLILRLIGAKLGAKLDKAVGGGDAGSSFVMAAAGSRIVRAIFEKLPLAKVEAVIGEAVTNRALMDDLLTRPTSYKGQMAQLKRLNAWIAAIDPMDAMVDEDETEVNPQEDTKKRSMSR